MINYRFIWTGCCCFLAIFLLAAVPALAVDDYGIFELEQGIGNADAEEDVGNNQNGVDWETLCDPDGSKVCQNGAETSPGGSITFSGIVTDPADTTIFGGGNKDIHDVSEWSWVDGAVPDKSDLLHAGAAAYNYNGDLVIYFEGDRYANSGDTYMGFWFFQDEVALDNGGFTGNHLPGDVLVLVNFPQSANADPLVQTLAWDPPSDPLEPPVGDNNGCAKKAGPNPGVGECAATNLRLLSSNSGDDAAVCKDNGEFDQDACANTNDGNRDAPWDYMAKTGETQFPYETFFEGGINISRLLQSEACFASFMAETRASSSFTAQLKDFVLGSFPLCGIDVSKLCYANTPTVGNTAGDISYTYDVAGCLTNDGFGKVTNLQLTDDPAFDADTLEFWTIQNGVTLTDEQCGAGSAIGDITVLYNAATLDTEITDPSTYQMDPNETVVWFAQFTSTTNADTDTVTASVETLSGATVPDATDSAICPGGAFTPGLTVTKMCDAKLTALSTSGGGSVAAVQADICGYVKNTGEVRMLNISISDSPAAMGLSPINTLLAGASSEYNGYYYPSGINDSTPPFNFSDTITATGYIEADLVENPPAYCLTVEDPTGLPAGNYYKCIVSANDTCNLCDATEASCTPPTP